MIQFLALQNTYTHVEVALYTNKVRVGFTCLDKTVASKQLIPAVHNLLVNHKTSIANLSFMAVNQGPGPFTTLRVVIASVNGIAFASGIPLIGINGLEGLLNECAQVPYPTVALLNAFGNDVYYGIKLNNTYTIGCKSIEALLTELSQHIDTSIQFVGNGATLFQERIQHVFGSRARIKPQATVSLDCIATMALEKWHQKKDLTTHVQPLYLKQAAY